VQTIQTEPVVFDLVMFVIIVVPLIANEVLGLSSSKDSGNSWWEQPVTQGIIPEKKVRRKTKYKLRRS
jgi:preprotein translocase subunit Sec63